MPTDLVKAALIVAWVLAVGALGFSWGATSIMGWALLVVVSLVPPVLMLRFWTAPAQSMSESIQKALR
jgi:hypothetical protein